MKKYFESPMIEIVEFESEDVITVSGLSIVSGIPDGYDFDDISGIFGVL